MKDKSSESTGKTGCNSLLWLLVLLFGALSIVCYQAYLPHMAMWVNDSHLGALEASANRMPGILTGAVVDWWWITFEVPAASPTVSTTLLSLMSPEMFLAFFTPCTMLLLGFSAWFLFRQLKFAPWVCVLGGLAAGLNMHCFSLDCWGMWNWNASMAMPYLAVAAMVSDRIRQTWIKASLAGLATGMAIMEGYDSGAILSVCIGAFVFYYCWITESTTVRRIATGVGASLLTIVFAVWIAASTLSTLVGTQIQGIADAGSNPQAKYDGATMWSLPKMESLRVIIPGLYGYRIKEYTTPPPPLLAWMLPTPPEQSIDPSTAIDVSPAYWGKVGEEPHVARLESSNPEVRAEAARSVGASDAIVEAMRSDNKVAHDQVLESYKSQVQLRFSGNGEYAGILTAIFAFFALFNSWRGASSPYSRRECLLVWFWGFAALFSLVASWGRFGPLYALIYHLPMMDKIRNPIKFLHPFAISWVILAGFGLEAYSRLYLQPAPKSSSAAKILASQSWWQRLSGFDRKYLLGMLAAVGAACVGYVIYAGYRSDLAQYLTHEGFDLDTASRIAAFSVRDVFWFVIIFSISTAVVLSALFRLWTERRALWLWGILSFIMIFDLIRADVPWVRYFDASKTYSMNDVTKFLMDKPYEHRVVGRLSPQGGYDLPNDQDFMAAIHWWLENDFPAHDIQSLEIDQMPRSPVMDLRYLGLFGPLHTPPRDGAPGRDDWTPVARLWKLTNTRYIFAAANFLPALNQLATPGHEGFRYVKRFNLVSKPGVTLRIDAGDITPQMTDQGTDALIECTDALPRAKLYSRWIIETNDDVTLQTLASSQWNPDQSVLVSPPTNGATIPSSSAAPNSDQGTVQITEYNPKQRFFTVAMEILGLGPTPPTEKIIKLQTSAKTPTVLLDNDHFGPGWRVFVDGRPADVLRCNYIMRGVYLAEGDHTVVFNFAPSLTSLRITLLAFLAGAFLLGYVCVTCRAARPEDAPA